MRLYGGLEDHLVDVFGFRIPVCPEVGGFTTEGRQMLQNLMALNTEQPAWVPAFTETGYLKLSIPADLYRVLLLEYERARPGMVVEDCARAVINCEEILDREEECSLHRHRRTFITNLSPVVLSQLQARLQPLAEDWAGGVKLRHSATYGVRRYTNGSWLTSHVDRFNTHVISAILNIGQKVDEDWPLYILDNRGREQVVLLQPGEMVWYESARAVHGRPQPLRGEFYDNLFIHFRPEGDWYHGDSFQVGPSEEMRNLTKSALFRLVLALDRIPLLLMTSGPGTRSNILYSLSQYLCKYTTGSPDPRIDQR